MSSRLSSDTTVASTVATERQSAVAAKRSAATKPTLTGDGASNRHFLLDKVEYMKMLLRCGRFEKRVTPSDVMRVGLNHYVAAPSPERNAGLMTDEQAEAFRALWKSADKDRVNSYLAAMVNAGWTTQLIADTLVSIGAVDKITRQAVSLRVNNVPDEPVDGLPEVPVIPHRRVRVSHRRGKKGSPKTQDATPQRAMHDLAFRIADVDYDMAVARAKSEGSMISAVLDSVIEEFLKGTYDEALVNDAA